jgi:hypothetical protein
MKHFALDAARWAEVCKRSQSFFRSTAYMRFDPKFRNVQAAEYGRAAQAIKEGRTPENAAIPSWPMPPMPAASHRIPLMEPGGQ